MCYFESSPKLKFDPKLLPLMTRALETEPTTLEISVYDDEHLDWLSYCIDRSYSDPSDDLFVPLQCVRFLREWDFSSEYPKMIAQLLAGLVVSDSLTI